MPVNIEGFGRRVPKEDLKKEASEQKNAESAELERVEIDREVDVLYKQMKEIMPTREEIQKDVETKLKSGLGDVPEHTVDKIIEILSSELYNNAETDALEKVSGGADKDALNQVDRDIYQSGSSNAHRRFDWLRASDLTFSQSHLEINPKTNELIATEIRERVIAQRKELMSKASEILGI